jgi:hypothetical protein
MIQKLSNNQSRGGARPGAGRKKGLPNKRTQEAQKLAEATGITPLEYLLSIMRDPVQEPRERLAAAVAAAPYVHAKLSAMSVSGDINHSHRGFVELPLKRDH